MQYERRPISRRKLLRISPASQPELFVSTDRISKAKKSARYSSLKTCAEKSSAAKDHFVKIIGPRNKTASDQLSSFLCATSQARAAGVFHAKAARMPAANESARVSIIGMIQCPCSQLKKENTRSTGQATSDPSRTQRRRRFVSMRTSGATTR